MPALSFKEERKHFENEAFRKRWVYDSHDISVPEFQQTQMQNDLSLCGRKTFDAFSEWNLSFQIVHFRYIKILTWL